MGKKVIDDDYAKPRITRLYRREEKMLNELVPTFPKIPIKQPRNGGPVDRKITDTEVVRIAIAELHKRRCKKKKKK